MSDVAVVIVNWNAGPCLAEAVASVLADPFAGAREVVVVDNASTDDSVALARRAAPGLTVVAMPANVGFAHGCNVGARASQGRYVVFLNPDAELRPGATAALVELAEAHPDTAVLGGLVVAPDGTPDPASRRNVPTPAMALGRLFRLGRREAPPYNLPLEGAGPADEVGAVSGSFLLARRTAFDALGGFDERFFLYAEDLDLCHRARLAGWTVRATSRAVAVHRKHVCAAQAPYRALWHFYRTMVLFHRKHWAATSPTSLNVAVPVGAALLWAGGVVRTALARGGTRLRLAPRAGTGPASAAGPRTR